ncbi:PR domain zinc finger protein 4-like [Gigantopelta aegis]|uniref:PR domain zinc finger protein 4-like n=1 Tax=Gigantopelta aegis TaxID=1735272 RepID=UPI001B8882E9|nr:PR domain zinc finger protein 4-like [Gigantopelta aegis]XP_041352286.1 PR domain zinc finger protein 4-like [Gigantopelta aegis]
MALSLLSQSNQQDQSSNCQPSVTMAMNLLAQVAHSESQSQSVDCQPNVTLAMSLLNQVSNANVIPHDECDTEQGGVASLASLSSSLAGQDGFPSVPANMAHMFQFSSPGVPSASQTQMLPAITFSPDAEGQQNLPTRVYMSSPITMVPMSHDQQDKNHHDHLTSPSPAALALANMSVIDMLLKSHGTELHAAEKSADDLPTSLAKTPAISGHYCVECNNTYKEPCKFHITDYMHLTDTPLLSRARASLPLTLNLQKSSLNGHFSDVGVFCNETVKLRTLLGPLVGKPVPCDMWQSGKKFVFWKIFFEDYFSVLDISDEDESNWLMFVKPARNALEQNLVAFQKDEEIYFVTCKDIEPGQELLFWYAKDYAKLLGLSPKPRRNGTSYCPYCCVCEKVFPDRKSLKLHKKEEHPNLTERKWACQFCHHRFTSSAKLNTHVIALHLHFKPFYCRHCGKQFADQSNLRHHMNIHTGEKKFVCETCQKSFRQKAHLTAHKLVHTGIKALQCQYCSVKFARRSDLKQHEYQHTKEKVYPCSECMKVFYKLQNYNKHVKIHNNERNYHCQHCPKTFVTSYHLKRHLKACKGLKNAAMKMTADADDVLFEDFNDNADDDEDGIARIIADVAPSEGSGVFESGGTRRSQRNVTRINLEET